MIEEKFKHILIDFPCLYDIDYATIAYVIYSCDNPDYMQLGYKDWTEYFAKCKLVSRPYINPLSAVMKEEYFDQIDRLYQDMLSKHKNTLLKISMPTDILRLVNMTYIDTGYEITVNCTDESEAQLIKETIPNWHTVINSTDKQKFFCYFFYDIDKRLQELPLLEGKSIYLYYIKPNFANFKEQIPTLNCIPYLEHNEFKIISPYVDFALPYDMTPNDLEVKENGKHSKLK